MTKSPRLRSVRLDEGGSVWIGGLARLDLERGPSFAVVPWISDEVSIARYTVAKSNLNYLKGFGTELFPTYSQSPKDVVFEKHEISFQFNILNTMNNQEINIFGLGSIGFRELPKSATIDGQKVMLNLYLAKGVEWCLRPSFLGVQEAKNAVVRYKSSSKPSQREFN